MGDAAELVGRDLLAQAGEADEVGEADRDVARARQRARLALGRVDGLVRTDWRRCRRAMYSSIGPIIGMKPATRSA